MRCGHKCKMSALGLEESKEWSGILDQLNVACESKR